jgi:hypothetical protein
MGPYIHDTATRRNERWLASVPGSAPSLSKVPRGAAVCALRGRTSGSQSERAPVVQEPPGVGADPRALAVAPGSAAAAGRAGGSTGVYIDRYTHVHACAILAAKCLCHVGRCMRVRQCLGALIPVMPPRPVRGCSRECAGGPLFRPATDFGVFGFATHKQTKHPFATALRVRRLGYALGFRV